VFSKHRRKAGKNMVSEVDFTVVQRAVMSLMIGKPQ